MIADELKPQQSPGLDPTLADILRRCVLVIALLVGCGDTQETAAAAGADTGALTDTSPDDSNDANTSGDSRDGQIEDTIDLRWVSGPPVLLGEFDADLANALTAVIEASFPAAIAPGLTLSVQRFGAERQTAYVAAAGLSRLDPEVAMAPFDRFRIGSITKTFTAAVVLQLVEAGELSLDDAADTWVDGFDLGAVTVRQLLMHTSGIFNYTDDIGFLGLSAAEATPEAVIEFALEHGPVFAPGTGYNYSNTGFFLLGLIIESVTGNDYEDEVRDRLLNVYGIDAFFETEAGALSATIDTSMVDGHLLGGESTQRIHMSWAWAAGGLVAHGADLCRWLELLFGGQVLSETHTEAMLTFSSNYGLGVQRHYRGGLALAGHTGSTMGFAGEVFVDLDADTCVAVLTNDFFGDATAVTEPVWELLSE